jgi:hypothetical protein
VKRKYDILAMDLDGTLLRSDGTVSPASIAAINRARLAGLRVIVCTGRGWVECRHILEQINQTDPVVVAGGAIVAEAQSGRTLHRFSMHEDLVQTAVRALLVRQHAALVLKDPSEAGYEYLVIHGENRLPLDPVTTWWFQRMNVRARFLDSIHQDEHPEHTVRVGACAPSGQLHEIEQTLADIAGSRGVIHNFPAVVAPKEATHHVRGMMHIIELFDADATKWSGINNVARRFNIDPHRIAAIGDEVNDLAMITQAGLGIAMGNAVPRVQAAATRQTATNNEDGLAKAIDKMLEGEW